MKTITILVPTYNEEQNIHAVYDSVSALFASSLTNYQMNLLFADNCSTDRTQALIQALCQQDPRVQAIFNLKNFGYNRSVFHAIREATGDAVVLLSADLQEPPEVIPKFVAEWEKGAMVVCGIKEQSKECAIVYHLREFYYRMMKKISDTEHIKQFNGFGLYDASFLRILDEIDDPSPYFRGIVAEMGPEHKEVCYTQNKRKAGKTHYGFWGLYDFAMLGITSNSKIVLRLATVLGFFVSFLCVLIALITLIQKLLAWNTFAMGNAALIVGQFLLGAIQLFFIGLLGEYLISINTRVIHRPLVIEDRRINFTSQKQEAEEQK